MFHNFLISYHMSQCNPLGALENRPRGKDSGGSLLDRRLGLTGIGPDVRGPKGRLWSLTSASPGKSHLV